MRVPQAANIRATPGSARATPGTGEAKAEALKGALSTLGSIGRQKLYIPIVDAVLRADPGVDLPSVDAAGAAIAEGGANLALAGGIPSGSVAVGQGDRIGRGIAQAAGKYLGTPYSWGGGGPGGPSRGFAQGANTVGFDCSSLVQYAYSKFGINVPRVTYDQYRAGFAVEPGKAQAGDLVFFNPGAQGPGHVGIYLGNGNFLHAPQTGDVVKVSKLSDRSDLVGIRRYR